MSDLVNRKTLIGAIEKCGEEKIYPQALIETIKALPSAEYSKPLQTTLNDDLISRAEVLALINKAMDNTNNKDIQDYLFCGLRRDVHHLPSADRQKGEWIDREDSTDLFFLYRYECSVCGGKNVFNSSYCPNCGAHMR